MPLWYGVRVLKCYGVRVFELEIVSTVSIVKLSLLVVGAWYWVFFVRRKMLPGKDFTQSTESKAE